MSLHTLMFGWEYPPAHCGGLGVACQGIVQGLLHHGTQVTLVLPHDQAIEDGVGMIHPGDESECLLHIGVSTLLQPYDDHRLYACRYQSLGLSSPDYLYGEHLGAEVERFTALAVAMTKHVHPDIIHTHDWMTLEAGIRAGKHHDRPVVAHVHATELDRTEFKPHAWIYERERSGLHRAHHIIAVSNYTRNVLLSGYGIRADQISVLHNGSFTAHPTALHSLRAQSHPLVLFLGRLTVQKGPLYFLRAASQIARVRPDVRFVMAGDGYLLPGLIQTACDLKLQDRVVFAGKVSPGEAVQLYSRAACFVMPSVSEPFGLVALEAITHGAPVVLSKQSGASEVVRNSLTVDFWDTDKMADCILTILREQALTDQMRSETPRILSNHTWDQKARGILSIYGNVIRDF